MSRAVAGFSALVVLVVSLSLGACATPRSTGAGEDEPPADLTVSVTVATPPALARTDDVPLGQRAGRYVLEPHGLLRSASGARAADETDFPGWTRRLTPEQHRAVWTLVRDGPLLTGAEEAVVSRAPDLKDPTGPGVRAVTYVISTSAQGRRRTLVIAPDGPGAAAAPAAEELAGVLAELAWRER